MTTQGTSALAVLGAGAVLAIACASSPPPAAPEPELVIPPMPSTVPAPPPTARRPPADPQRSPPPEPAEPDQPALAPPALPAAGMAVPSPVALRCKNDGECLTHRCNPNYGKCAYPCRSDIDCMPGTTCFTRGGATATCIPKPP